MLNATKANRKIKAFDPRHRALTRIYTGVFDRCYTQEMKKGSEIGFLSFYAKVNIIMIFPKLLQ